ncbi:MAG: hypothetical protein IJN16_02175, partial [Lachnospiraceae bacterium]|nr:hypothetical protein [Lachnospiraceae bacterium]
MAIEPLGSIMSVQAQTTVQNKPVVKTEQSTGDNYSSASAQEAMQVDRTINVVQDTQQKGNNAEQGREQQQPSNEQIKKAVEQFNKNMF